MSLGHNFIALKATADEGATITATVIGGSGEVITMDEDGICVFQLMSTATAIQYTATKGSVTETKTISLSLLTRAEA